MAMPLTDEEATMEMILPILVTDVMQYSEEQGKHPEADFTGRVREAILKILGDFPNIEEDMWDDEKKQKVIEAVFAKLEW